jgi:hypothetical protein
MTPVGVLTVFAVALRNTCSAVSRAHYETTRRDLDSMIVYNGEVNYPCKSW